MLMPFFTYLGIFTIKAGRPKLAIDKIIKAVPLAAVFLLVNFLMYYFSRSKEEGSSGMGASYMHVIAFQVLSFIFIESFHVYYNKNVSGHKDDPYKPDGWPQLLSHYSRSIALMLFVISVVPPVTFLYFAYHEEKKEEVKSRQLQLAHEIELRNNKIENRYRSENRIYKNLLYDSFYNDRFINNLKIKNVFASDSISFLDKKPLMISEQDDHDLYSNLLAVTGKNQESTDNLYGLKNASGDSSWFWTKDTTAANKMVLIYNSFGERKLPVKVESAIPLFITGNMKAWPYAVFFAFMIAAALYAVYQFVQRLSKTIFFVGYHKSFDFCMVEEVFFEKFHNYFNTPKIIVLDEKSSFTDSVRKLEHYEIIEYENETGFEGLMKALVNSNKKVIIVRNYDTSFTNILLPAEASDKSYFNTLAKLDNNGKSSKDYSEWEVVFIVKPLKINTNLKFTDQLKYQKNMDAWMDKAIGSLSIHFELIGKAEYAKALHQRLRNMERPDVNAATGKYKNWDQEEFILNLQHRFEDTYEILWKSFSEQEKFVIFDFAQDEFTNPRNENTIKKLIRKGVLIYENDSLQILNESFRNFILAKSGTLELADIEKQIRKPEKWDIFRIALFIIVIAVAVFIFFTQEEVFQQITALIASLMASVSLMLKFFEQSKTSSSSTS
jgi:hypothetical protein